MTDTALDEGQEPKEERGFSPPYISYATFVRVLDRLSEDTPPRIDRTFLPNMSGSQQTQMLQALRAFSLLGEGGKVKSELVELAKPQTRKAALKDLLEEHFAGLIDLGKQKATQGQMEEWFRPFKYSRRTMGKAVAFYLQAAEEAGVPVSPHFGAVKDVRNAPTQPKGRPQKPEKPKDERLPQQNPPPAATSGNRTEVDLASGGKVSISVEIDLFTASDYDQKFVLDLVKAVRDYGAGRPQLPAGPSAPNVDADTQTQ